MTLNRTFEVRVSYDGGSVTRVFSARTMELAVWARSSTDESFVQFLDENGKVRALINTKMLVSVFIAEGSTKEDPKVDTLADKEKALCTE